jgi:intracellular sulfur oxidation DsrE/DsrF family protein
MNAARSLVIALLIGLAGILAKPAWSADNAATMTRIVVQVNESDARKWNAILGNLRNIQQELGPKRVAIAVVAIGPGLDMLMADSLVANEVQDALAAGVEFVACENTMHARKIERADLIDGIGYARAGYVEIVKRQQAGWSYLRP